MTTRARQVAASSGYKADYRTSATALGPATAAAAADSGQSGTSLLLAETERRSFEWATTSAGSMQLEATAPATNAQGAAFCAKSKGAETLGEPPGLSEILSKTRKKCLAPPIFADSSIVSPSPSKHFGVVRPLEGASSKSSAATGLLSASSLSYSATPVPEVALRHPLQHCTTPVLTGRSGGHSRSVRLHEQQRLRRLVRLDSSFSESAERMRIEASGGSARRMRLDASTSLARRMFESQNRSLEKLRPGSSIDTIQQLLLEASSSAKKATRPDAPAGSPAKVQRHAASCSEVQMPALSNCGTLVVSLKGSGSDSIRAWSDAKVRKPDDVTTRRCESISRASTATAQAEAASGNRAERSRPKESVVASAGKTTVATATGSSFEELQGRAVGSRSDIARASRKRTKETLWERTATGELISGSNGDRCKSSRGPDFRMMPLGSRGSPGRSTKPVAAERGDRDAKSSVARAADDTSQTMLSRNVVLSKSAHVSSDPQQQLTESVGMRKAAALPVVRSSCIQATMPTLGDPMTKTNDGAPVYQRLLKMQPDEPTSGRLLPSQMYEQWRQELQQKQTQCESVQSGKLQAFDHKPKSVGRSPSDSEGSSKRSCTDSRDRVVRPSSASVHAIPEVNRRSYHIEATFQQRPLSSGAAAAGRGVVSRESSCGSSPPALLPGRKVGACRGEDSASSAGTAAVLASGGNGQSKVVSRDVPVVRDSKEASMQQSEPPKKSSAARRSSRVALPRRVSDLKDLTDDQLHLMISKHIGYLRDVRNGKVECWRHEAFEIGTMRMLRSLDFATPACLLTGEQLELIGRTLSSDKTLCDPNLTGIDYVLRVLLPEMITLLYMEVHNMSRRNAEAALKRMCM